MGGLHTHRLQKVFWFSPLEDCIFCSWQEWDAATQENIAAYFSISCKNNTKKPYPLNTFICHELNSCLIATFSSTLPSSRAPIMQAASTWRLCQLQGVTSWHPVWATQKSNTSADGLPLLLTDCAEKHLTGTFWKINEVKSQKSKEPHSH